MPVSYKRKLVEEQVIVKSEGGGTIEKKRRVENSKNERQKVCWVEGGLKLKIGAKSRT